MRFEASNIVRLSEVSAKLERELHDLFEVVNPRYADTQRLGRFDGHLEPTLSFCRVESLCRIAARS